MAGTQKRPSRETGRHAIRGSLSTLEGRFIVESVSTRGSSPTPLRVLPVVQINMRRLVFQGKSPVTPTRTSPNRHFPALSSGVLPERPDSKKPRREAEAKCLFDRLLCSRDDRIRTCDPLNPIQVRYRAAPHPVAVSKPADRLEKIILSPAPDQCLPAGFRCSERAVPGLRNLGRLFRCPPLLSSA